MLHFGKPIVIPGVNDLPQTYAICHVKDIASMYVTCIRQSVTGTSAPSGVHFADHGVEDWRELARARQELCARTEYSAGGGRGKSRHDEGACTYSRSERRDMGPTMDQRTVSSVEHLFPQGREHRLMSAGPTSAVERAGTLDGIRNMG
jgi:hypothetical protein